MSITRGTPLRVWPGVRGGSGYRAVALAEPKDVDGFQQVRVRYVSGPHTGQSDRIMMTHVEVDPAPTFTVEEVFPDPVLFEPPPPPATGVSLDVDAPAGWNYRPDRLRAVADALRPFLAAGVEPLEVAVLALDADVSPPGCSRCDG